jgi:hypothetical protein|tara:strand:- start:182 stop:589 length:408 start_codon:yes stop_codon:yes gene_type:complete
VSGKPDVAGICHCRYCQLRSGSAFGALAYFEKEKVSLLSGNLTTHNFKSESGNAWQTQFCPKCGTTVFLDLAVFEGKTGVDAGTFDPPTFWFDIINEVFVRSKAHFLGDINAVNHEETFFTYDPETKDESRLMSD